MKEFLQGVVFVLSLVFLLAIAFRGLGCELPKITLTSR